MDRSTTITEQLSASEIELVYRALIPGLITRGRQWLCACPIHKGERDDSFAIDAVSGRWFCHSDCGHGGDLVELSKDLLRVDFRGACDYIEQVIGREVRDRQLGPGLVKFNAERKRRIIAEYSYTDESGAELFQVCRYDPKGFSQRRRGLDGEWVPSLKATDALPAARIVPYRLHRLAAATTVLVVEGERDVEAAEVLGFTATCNPGGAGKWRKEYARYLRDKIVVVIPDMDEAGKPGQQHAAEVGRSVLGPKCSVKLMPLPGAKDLSEWAAQEGHDAEMLRVLIAGTPALDAAGLREWEKVYEPSARQENRKADPRPEPAKLRADREPTPRPAGRTPYIDPNGRPLKEAEIARLILRDRRFISNSSGNIYEYQHPTWNFVSPEDVHTIALRAEPEEHTSGKRRDEIVRFIRADSNIGDIPWRSIEPHEIPFHNGVYNSLTGQLRVHRAEDYLETIIPHDFDPDATCEKWKSCLFDWFGAEPDYEERVACLQEFAGYILVQHARFKKCLFVYGESNTGKSELAKVFQMLAGPKNCTAIKIEQMDNPRALAPIRGKLLNTITELQREALLDEAGFKKLVSVEEGILIDPKFVKPEMYVPFAKHVFVMNSLPSVGDASKATFNRMMLLKFERVFRDEEQDYLLPERLEREIEGIAAWAVAGARRLHENNGIFTEPVSSRRGREQYRMDQNPVNLFFEEKMQESLGSLVPFEQFRESFSRWSGKKWGAAFVAHLIKSAGIQVELAGNQGLSAKGRFLKDVNWIRPEF